MIGCYQSEVHAKKSLDTASPPLHLWSKELLKRIGDSCGAFVAADERHCIETKIAVG